ncbi:disulfide bond formation protein B [Ferrovibrio terrae]|uniref:Disulfide bond formation protein B n=1 Tax=Ferrovibrio terrae TaxID=2594003 RepID=A0A516H2D1_9PROT|nr:disulfide bond formation protein B [Ferrovibrio terrae]QDO97933.1 disulfide bond formation protein B [Ferrovibrio terrae]
MIHSLYKPNRSGLLVALAAAGTLALVLIAQYGFGLPPCEMCHWQRWPYIAALIFGLGALVLPRWRVQLLGLAALSFAITGGIGVFHAGVEWKWWQGLTSCGGTSTATSLEDLRAQIMAAPVVRCDEAAIRVLGLSMAGWNALWAAVLAIFAVLATRRAAREAM